MTSFSKALIISFLLILWVVGFLAIDAYSPKPQPKAHFNPSRFQSLTHHGLPTYLSSRRNHPLIHQTRPSNIIAPESNQLPPSMIPQEMRVHTQLHYVGAHGLPPRKEQIEVLVKNTHQPITLFLNAYNHCNWHIQTEPGTRLTKVIAAGYETQTVSGLPSSIPIFSYAMKESPRAYIDTRIATKGQYLNVLEKVHYLTGVTPATVQFDFYPQKTYVVDGISTITFPNLNDKYDQSRVKLHCSMCVLGPDGLSATYAGPASMASATRSYNSGKYYFEASIKLPSGKNMPSSYTNIGVSSSPQYMTIFNFPSEYGYAYGALGPNRVNNQLLPGITADRATIKSGDLIGIALDFDRNKMFFSVNGKWINGQPASSKGMSLKSGLDYTAIVSTATSSQSEEDDIWTINFGEKPFKHSIPLGYSPYGTPMKNTVTLSPPTVKPNPLIEAPSIPRRYTQRKTAEEDTFDAQEARQYKAQLKQVIYLHWNPPQQYRSLPVSVSFRVRSDGKSDHLKILKSSGNALADEVALKAIREIRVFPPLTAYSNQPYINIVWTFGTGKELNTVEFDQFKRKMRQKLLSHWAPEADFGNRQTEVTFSLSHSGHIKNAHITKSSGLSKMDSSALTAVRQADPLPPLPANYHKEQINVIWTFRMDSKSPP